MTNDAQLRAVAKAQLDEDLNGQFNVLGYAGAFRINKKQVGNDLAIVITARYDYQNTLLNMVLTDEVCRYEGRCQREPGWHLVQCRCCGQQQ